MGYRVVVVGATGTVGREMLNVLAERAFDADEVAAVASRRSEGKQISFGEKTLSVEVLEDFDFSGWDIGLFSPGASVSSAYAPKAARAGCVVIDNSSHFRMDPDVPLVVPEVNPEAVNDYTRKRIIANPNCSTIQMVVALKPLYDTAGIKRIVVSTYQSTSGAGNAAMEELFQQTKSVYMNNDIDHSKFTKQIAFNVIPHIDKFLDDGSTKEEWKMEVETKKILGSAIKVTATCVRVPVFIGHGEAVNVELERSMSAEEARSVLRKAPGILIVDEREDGGYITPVEAAGESTTYVSRIREDPTVKNGLNLWVVADNLRKGAALNSVQIAELLVNRKLLTAA